MERICVYCGSRTGEDERYRTATAAFGAELARREIGLVYGGGGVGLMGVLAESVLDAGGEAIGVIPEGMANSERPPADLTETIVVDSMHTRKQTMFERAEGFVALPGGLGTLEELLEMLTWSQLGIHDYPCGVLNVAGYYDGLVTFLDTAVSEGFVPAAHRDLLTVGEDPASLLDALAAFTPPEREKRMDVDEA